MGLNVLDSTAREIIKYDDLMVLDQGVNEVTADEAGTTSDEYSFHG